jgi:S-formylglutathione hydrolase
VAGRLPHGLLCGCGIARLDRREFPADPQKWGIFGHSMGGHGALVTALRNPERFRSVSAFAPIAAPSNCPWGQKAFTNYLGPEKTKWAEWDATAPIGSGKKAPPILIDIGLKDQFLDRELYPHLFEAACAKGGQKLTLRRQEGYDHSYYFISTFMADHIAHHKAILGSVSV